MLIRSRWTLLAVVGSAMISPAVAQFAEGDFVKCGSWAPRTCVADGDTVWLEGEEIILEGIVAPSETDPECATEAVLAFRAIDRLLRLLNRNEWTLTRVGVDEQGRTRGEFRIGDTSVAQLLLDEDLVLPALKQTPSWC